MMISRMLRMNNDDIGDNNDADDGKILERFFHLTIRDKRV